MAVKTIDDYKKDWEAANAAGRQDLMDAAHAGAEALRAKAGYSGGADGSEYIPIESTFSGSATGVGTYTPEQESIVQQMNENSKNWWVASADERDALHAENEYLSSLLGGSISYDGDTGTWSGDAEQAKKLLQQNTGYNSQYSTQIDALLNSILNREPFSYDYTTDPTYLAYEQKYKRLGDRAREDTLGDISALNGGYASSWAVSAASQAQNDYNQQLADVIPTLYEAAYNRYLDEDSLKRNDLGLVMDVDNMYYDRYRDTVADDQWQQEFDLSKNQSEFNQMLDRWNTTGKADSTVADYFGVTEGTPTSSYYFEELSMKAQEQATLFNQMLDRWSVAGTADNEVAAYFGVAPGTSTSSHYFEEARRQLNQDNFDLDKEKWNTSKNEQSEADADQAYLEDSIVRQAREVLGEAGTVEAATAAAEYVLSAGVTSAAEFFSIGSRVGIPTAVLQSTFDKFYNMALQGAGDGEADIEEVYAAYEKEMLAHVGSKDPEAWYSKNYNSIPYEIRQMLQERVLEDAYR